MQFTTIVQALTLVTAATAIALPETPNNIFERQVMPCNYVTCDPLNGGGQACEYSNCFGGCSVGGICQPTLPDVQDGPVMPCSDITCDPLDGGTEACYNSKCGGGCSHGGTCVA